MFYELIFCNIDEEIFKMLYSNNDSCLNAPSALFYFQNKLNEHYFRTDENLLEKVSDKLIINQIKELKLKTNIELTDSFLATSNIREIYKATIIKTWRKNANELGGRKKESQFFFLLFSNEMVAF
ncbi:MAG: hypothetical protein PVH88_02720 [Ignavibacteria bacterium]|jgi:hypothetical protein